MALVQKASFKSASAVKAARPARSAVVVRASAERRAVLGGLLGAAVLLTQNNQAQALTPVDLFDDRKVKNTGFDYIYEARDLDLPQATRDGFTQARTDIASTLKRIKESESRIDAGLETFVKKNYWTEAREQLRRQVGTLRFDINALASTKTKDAKKKALELKKEFLSQVEALDYALREKKEDAALSKLAAAQKALDNVIAAL